MAISEDALAVLLGFIGGEWGIKKMMKTFKMGTGSKMWIKMLLGALLMYFGMTEGFYFLSNIGVGVGGGGIYEYILANHTLDAYAGEFPPVEANNLLTNYNVPNIAQIEV